MNTPPDFSIDALYSALDAERACRGLTWTQLTREVNAQYRGVRIRPISVSTIPECAPERAIEGDGVLQMLVWSDDPLQRASSADTTDRRSARVAAAHGPVANSSLRHRALLRGAGRERLRLEGAPRSQLAASRSTAQRVESHSLRATADDRFPQIVQVARWLGDRSASRWLALRPLAVDPLACRW